MPTIIPETDDELIMVTERYGLPEPPEPEGEEGEPGTVRLVLFRFNDDKIQLADGISLADAKEYCDREDTHGDGYFVGFYTNEE